MFDARGRYKDPVEVFYDFVNVDLYVLETCDGIRVVPLIEGGRI